MRVEEFVDQYNSLCKSKGYTRIAKDYHDYGHVDIEHAGDVIATITYGPPAHYSTCFLADMDWTFFSESYTLGYGSQFTADELKLMLEFSEGVDRSKGRTLFG